MGNEKFEKRLEWLKDYESIIPLNCSGNVRKFIVCQFAIESDFGMSKIAYTNNNISGMRYPVNRVTTAVCQNFGFADYHRELDCIIDYCIWLACNGFTQRILNDYSLFINHPAWSKYCPEKDYVQRIINLINQYYGE